MNRLILIGLFASTLAMAGCQIEDTTTPDDSVTEGKPWGGGDEISQPGNWFADCAKPLTDKNGVITVCTDKPWHEELYDQKDKVEQPGDQTLPDSWGQEKVQPEIKASEPNSK